MSYSPFQPVGILSNSVPVALTGTTVTTTLFTYTLKAFTIGSKDWLEVYGLFSCNNNANAKTVNITLAATTIFNLNMPNSTTCSKYSYIFARNSTTAQVATASGNGNTFGNVGSRVVGAIDTTIDNTFLWRGTLANAADTIQLEALFIKRFKSVV